MAHMRIYADDVTAQSPGTTLTTQIVNVVRELTSDQAQDISTIPGAREVTAHLGDVTSAQAERFVSRIVELSRISGLSFTISITLDDEENRTLLWRNPEQILGDSHVIHVRPTEGPVLNAYFEYLFGRL